MNEQFGLISTCLWAKVSYMIHSIFQHLNSLFSSKRPRQPAYKCCYLLDFNQGAIYMSILPSRTLNLSHRH